MTISRVQGLDTDVDEFGVAFESTGTNGRDVLATIRRRTGNGARDRILTAQIERVIKAVTDAPVVADGLQSSIGGGSRRASHSGSSDIHFAARVEGSLSGDYDLFQGNYRNQRIETPERNDFSSVVRWDAQPAISPDGGALYFASDRDGSLGGTDIYVMRRNTDGEWDAPKNLGPGINTPCDELSPFISGDGKWLYFASSGHRTFGGYDLFRAQILGNSFGAPENLGSLINTASDELFAGTPAMVRPDTLLYFSSNRPGSNGFDVYVFHRRWETGSGTTQPGRPVQLSGTVKDGRGTPIDSALVTIEQRDPPGALDSTRSGSRGEYEFVIEQGKSYEVIGGKEGRLYGKEDVYVPEGDPNNSVTRDIIVPDTLVFRVNFPFNNATDPYEFTLDDDGLPTDITWSDVVERTARFLKTIPAGSGKQIEVVGHTDPIGSDAFNLDLGRRRAEFVKRELIKRGVAASLLTVGSAGESRPLSMRDEEPDPLYRARLRRVELYIR